MHIFCIHIRFLEHIVEHKRSIFSEHLSNLIYNYKQDMLTQKFILHSVKELGWFKTFCHLKTILIEDMYQDAF